jgi:thermitase
MKAVFTFLFVITMNCSLAQGVKKDQASSEYKVIEITNAAETTLKNFLKRTELDSVEIVNSLRAETVKYALIPISDLTTDQLRELDRDLFLAEKRLSKKKTVVAQVPIISEGQVSTLLTNEFIIRFQDTVSSKTIRRFFTSNKIDILRRSTYDSLEYLVSFKTLTSGIKPELLDRRDTVFVEYITPNVTTITPKSSAQRRDPIAMENIPFGAPKDELVKFQWHLFQIALLATNAADTSCCDISKNGTEVIVAILDEGVDTLHVDLKDKIVRQFDILRNKPFQYPGPNETHGTACAGIVAASNNDIGVCGIACNARIMPIRIWNPSLKSVFNAVEGIRHAIHNGAKVINCSWELRTMSKQDQKPVNRVIDEAIRNNCILVFAAGNSGADSVAYPGNLASVKNIITVAATNRNGQIKTIDPAIIGDWGSQFGKGVTLAAPGVEIYTTYNTFNNESKYDLFDGTSSATPIVSGAIALMLSIRPDLTPADVIDIISRSCDAPNGSDSNRKLGNGILNVKKMLKNASKFPRQVNENTAIVE